MAPRPDDRRSESPDQKAPAAADSEDPRRIAAWSRTLDPGNDATAREFAAPLVSRLADLARASPPVSNFNGSDSVSTCLERLTEQLEALRRSEIPSSGWDPWLGLPREQRLPPIVQFLRDFRRLGNTLLQAHEVLTIERARLMTESGDLEIRRHSLAEIRAELDAALQAGEAFAPTARTGFREILRRRLTELRHHRVVLAHQQAQLELAAVNLTSLVRQVDDTLAATLPLMLRQMTTASGLLRTLAVSTGGETGVRTRREAEFDRLTTAIRECRDLDGLHRQFARLCSLIDRAVRPNER